MKFAFISATSSFVHYVYYIAYLLFEVPNAGVKLQRTMRVSDKGKGTFLLLVPRSCFATWRNALCVQATGSSTAEP